MKKKPKLRKKPDRLTLLEKQFLALQKRVRELENKPNCVYGGSGL